MMRKWILWILVLAIIGYAGRELIIRFERAVQDNHRAEAELVEELGKRRTEQMMRTIEARQAEQAERLNQAIQEAH